MKKIPQHVAIIMDGNRRFAKAKGMPSIKGHEAGSEALRGIIEESMAQKIRYLTVFAFSSENWNRDKTEVSSLFLLMERLFKKEIQALHDQNIRIRMIGEKKRLPKKVISLIEKGEDLTKDNTALNLVIALNYGARQEMVRGVQSLVAAALEGTLDKDMITEETFSNALDTKGMPDPDLFIRPGGEYRLSNFLLWQLSYAELYFSPVCWPDFSKECYQEALIEYDKRQRRFGE
jgi:undecaprenyl diphosphate synthase